LFVGEIGVSRHEFLYDITFWEAKRIIRGYHKRDRLTHQLLAEVYYAALYANPYRQNDGKTIFDKFPQIFEDDDDEDDEPAYTPEEEEHMQELMRNWNMKEGNFK
jgi:hypothetical protein